MIISTALLSQFIDISNIEIDELCESLNDIGIEVEELIKIRIHEKVIVGKIASIVPHPNANKLNVCQVDIGKQTLQIVCGAKNVKQDQFVALALEGAILPAQNESKPLEIKKTALRGVESFGMICSSSELGLAKINEGIMILDSSVGELELGKSLCEYGMFNQFIIDVSITPNRGDCLSVLGIARELVGVYGLPIKLPQEKDYGLVFGVDRALRLHIERKIESLLLYKVVEINDIETTLQMQLMLAYSGMLKDNPLQNYKNFATYMTGVLFNLYPIAKSAQIPAVFNIKKDSSGLERVMDSNDEELSAIGLKNNIDESKLDHLSSFIVIEANHSNPEFISRFLFAHKIPSDKDVTYYSTRGSNPQLLIGMNFLCELLNDYAQCSVYSGHYRLNFAQENRHNFISISFKEIEDIIGKNVNQEEIITILKRLNFEIEANGDGVFFRITPPEYRFDIQSAQDVAEEFLRIYRIKNIPSIPYSGAQKRGISDTLLKYYNKRDLATRAIAMGFFEAIHYVFYQRSKLIEWNLPVLQEKLELTNPITNELDTLRTSLLPALFDSIERNQNLGYKNIKMFEIGSVYDENRVESTKMAFVASGLQIKEAYPHPKGVKWDFYSFCEVVSKVIGHFELEAESNAPIFAHPYQFANILQNKQKVGIIGKLHPVFAKKYDIQEAFFAEIDTLNTPHPSNAQEFSRFHPSQRDLTIIINKNTPFSVIKKEILESQIPHLQSIYPLDIYEDSNFYLTIRVIFESFEKSLTEELINNEIQKILKILESKFGAKLKV